MSQPIPTTVKFLTIPKVITMWFILSVVLERMVRFLSTVDAMLEEYNKGLPNNK